MITSVSITEAAGKPPIRLIPEEGLPINHPIQIIDSVAGACVEAPVKITAGHTKAVPRGHLDKIFINKSCIGLTPPAVEVGCHHARPGDLVIINGTIGDHGIAILTEREGLKAKGPQVSDSAPLNALVSEILAFGPDIHLLTDPTRGGLATALNEIARHSRVGGTRILSS